MSFTAETATPAPVRTAAPVRVVTPPARVAEAERAPLPRPTPTVPSYAVAPPAHPIAAPTAAPFGVVAQSTVRGYLDDIIAGNERAAYAALGHPNGGGGAELTEEAFLDRTARIVSLRTTGVDASGATVGAQITTESGTYYATYHVTNGPNGPVIDQHDYIKV